MNRLTALLVFMLAACAADEQNAATVSDSAGVRVVTNAAPDSSAPTFRLSAEPLASIGTADGAPEYQLFRASGTVLGDGTILVVNNGTQEIRWFDKAGKYLHSAGGKGEGPGEFGMGIGLTGVLAGDSLLFSDLQYGRFQVFDKTGKYVRSFTAPKEIQVPNTAGVLTNGTIVALDRVVGIDLTATDPFQGRAANGRLRLPKTISLIAADASSVKALGRFPGDEASIGPTGNAGVLFGRGLHAEARGNRIAVANDDAYSIRIYDGSGKLLQIVRQARQAVPVTSEDYERGLPPFMLPGAPDSRFSQMMKPLWEQMYHHTTFPAFGGYGSVSLRFDAAGNLWVQEYQAPFDTTTAWQAFSPAGAFLGRLDLPEKTRLLDVAPDWVLVKVFDDLDVEHIVLYGLERR